MAKNDLKFSALWGVSGTYEVRRDGVLLGQVSETTEVVMTRRDSCATFRKARRWQFQMVGADVCRSKYTTRKAAAAGLASWFDAHEKAKSRAQGEG